MQTQQEASNLQQAANNTNVEEQDEEPLLATTNSDSSATSLHFQFTIRDALKKIMYSRVYWIFCLIMIIICIFLLLWTIIQGGHPRQLWFILLEGVVNILLVTEVLFRIILEGKVLLCFVLHVFVGIF